MNKQTVKIFEEFINDINAEFIINSIVNNGNNTFTLNTDNTWWLSILDKITVDNEDFIINSFVINESITVTPVNTVLVFPLVSSFAVIQPTYKHGTLKMTKNEINKVNDKTELVPFVYLLEIIRDRKDTDEESAIDREVDLRLFFLNSANFKDWLTDQHYTNVIEPMQQMVDLFIDNLNDSRFITDEFEYEAIPLINFSSDGNQENSIFDCNLSGIEVKLFAKIKKDLSC